MTLTADAAVFVPVGLLKDNAPFSSSELQGYVKNTRNIVSRFEKALCVLASQELAASWRGMALCELLHVQGALVLICEDMRASLILASEKATCEGLLTREALPPACQHLQFGGWQVWGGNLCLVRARQGRAANLSAEGRAPPALSGPEEVPWEEFPLARGCPATQHLRARGAGRPQLADALPAAGGAGGAGGGAGRRAPGGHAPAPGSRACAHRAEHALP